MNITVNVDEVTLDTVVAEVYGYDEDGYDEDGYAGKQSTGTIADLVAAKIVEKVAADETRWHPLTRHVAEIRAELIREMIRPQIEQALSEPFSKTNGYGEPAGQPVTLRTLIVEETKKALTAPVDCYNRDKGSFVTQLVRDEVRKAFAAEVADAVKQARAAVADEVGQMVASSVQAAMKAR